MDGMVGRDGSGLDGGAGGRAWGWSGRDSDFFLFLTSCHVARCYWLCAYRATRVCV